MGKAKKTASGGSYDFMSLVSNMQNVNPDSHMLSDSPFSKIEKWIGLGNYLLNAQISGDIFGGIPEGRVTGLAGFNGTGKTYLSLNAAREAQELGYNVVWIDTENALDIDGVSKFGIDIKRFAISKCGVVSEVTKYVSNLCDDLLEKVNKGISVPNIFIVIDSIGNLASDKETADAKSGENKADMGARAKDLRKMFRVIINKLGKLKIPMICTNHIGKSVGNAYIENDMGGGEGLKFGASTILFLSKAKLKSNDKEKTQTGIIVTSKIRKSRFTIAGVPIKFHISFYKGMNPYLGLEDYVSWDVCGIEAGSIDKKGNFVPAGSNVTSYAIKHLNETVKPNHLFTPEIFTQDVLEKLRPVIMDKFQFKSSDEYSDIDDLLDLNESDETEGDDED